MLTTAVLLLRSSLFLSLHLAGNAGSFPKPLSAEEEQVYLARCAQGDLEARNVLVERNMRLVAHIIKNGYPEGKVFMGGKRTDCVPSARQGSEYPLAGDSVVFSPQI
ncbi:MAG: hypothetical protein K2O84_06480 [Oscillospiraceae bacterium]|nr:hypothetical protein [Oscillospiraceae bacterium]